MIKIKKITFYFLIYCFLFILFSCNTLKTRQAESKKITTSNLIVYLYQPDHNPVDINFSIDKISIRQKKGIWFPVSDKKQQIKSISTAGHQILLFEALLPPGEYDAIRLMISEADLRWEDRRMNLSPPDSPWELQLPVVTIEPKKTSALFLEWNPGTSLINNYLFKPEISVNLQQNPPKNVTMYVANSGSNYISIINRHENRVVGILNVEERPTEIVLSKDQKNIFVLNSASRSVSIIDTTENYLVDRIHLPSGVEPTDMDMIPSSDNPGDGKLYISNKGSNDISVVDTLRRNQIKIINVGSAPHYLLASPEREEVYVSNTSSNSISVINTQNDTIKETISVDTEPGDLMLIKNDLYVMAGARDRIIIIDTKKKNRPRTFSAGYDSKSAIYSQQLNRIFVTNYGPGAISFLIPPAAFSSTASLEPYSPVITKNLKVGPEPLKMAFDEDRNKLFVTIFGSNEVKVVNPLSEMIDNTITVGANPYGIAFVR